MTLSRRYAVAMTLAVAALIFAVVMFPKLPAQVPVHWSATGAVDGWTSKDIGAFIVPVIALVGVGLIMIREPENRRKPDAGAIQWVYPTMGAVFAGLMLYVTILMVLAATGAHPGIPTDVIAGVGILVAAIGSSLGMVPQRSRTRRVAAWLFAVAGSATVAVALISRSAWSAF